METTRNHVFLLTGKARLGKSTAMKAILQQLGPGRCGGFFTEEMRDASDRIGFRCVTADGDSEIIASVASASPLRIGRYGVEVERFEAIALPAIRRSLQHKQITLIDEIGFMQVLSEPFAQLLEEIVLNERYLIAGTVCLDSHPVIDRIKRAPGIELVMLTEDNRDGMAERFIRGMELGSLK
ncbi:nucleoside-triphosphatase [Paenibacillus sp. R14(2021)]|uniref:nucleoside-triphosphatase n=1 Tax=Paenibacillus sp. R14(2021) TaxID=2859228 RepID=UPI001C613222|nr:nucleoside-triphosphatase [Paenibacillus sp. R14(2021)]